MGARPFHIRLLTGVHLVVSCHFCTEEESLNSEHQAGRDETREPGRPGTNSIYLLSVTNYLIFRRLDVFYAKWGANTRHLTDFCGG